MSLGRVKEKIEATARNGHLLYYEDLLLSDMGDDDDDRRRTLYAILDKLNNEEHAKSGVWLSSIVVGKDIGMPGEGFFRKYRQRFGVFAVDKSENFVLFAQLARQVFRHYNAADDYGILIDADNVAVAATGKILQNLLQVENGRLIVCRAFGNNAEWGNKLRKNYGIDFFHTPPKEHEIKNATDFRLYVEATLRVIRGTHHGRLINILYLMSCDRGFKHLADTAKKDGIEVRWLDNKGKSHPLG